MWSIDYKYEVNQNGLDSCEWWEVSNSYRIFKSDLEKDAEWLCEVLNSVGDQ